MGGRGSSSPGYTLTPPEALPYQVIQYDDDQLGGAIYPFLEQTGWAWYLVTQPVGETAAVKHTFGLTQPTMRWVNGEQVHDLYVAGMDTEQFLGATGLQLNLDKGGFVLSKRLSRLMRPHFVSGFFDAGEVQVAYLEQTPEEARVWDGAGLISRQMVRKMLLSEDLPPAKREQLEQELHYAQRVEFTVMTARGQDKGHAIVADDLRDENGRLVDFLLPQDTKREVQLTSDQTFVGLSLVHGHHEMRLDIQSLINLYPFFREKQLLDWLQAEGSLFMQAVETGAAGQAMARIDRHTRLAEVQRWPLREYLASGGQPMWFGSHVKSLMNQHLRRLNHTTLGKMRLPIPGGRQYVMPAAVGQRAGITGLDVPRGHIQIDEKRGTAWVNDQDWLVLADSPQGAGIADILGGADNDDALWLHPFTDHDGQRQVLAWRSPNQVGEYVVLKPTAGSDALPWAEADGETAVYPPGDSRRLPPRIDMTAVAYLHLVDAATAGGLGEGEAYSVAVMERVQARAEANRGALGMYCNALMVQMAVNGRLPENPPAPLEKIIDSAVKTGADLSQVVAWNYEHSRELLTSRIPIPAVLHHRLRVDGSDPEKRPPSPIASHDHWLDRLVAGVQAHIKEIQARRDELAGQARPPQVLFDQMAADPEAVRLGAGLNQVYAGILRLGKKGSYASVLARARAAAADYLAHFPPAERGRVLRGALVRVYGGERPLSDRAAWLPEIGSQTVAALRESGVLDEVIQTGAGLVVYPAGLDAEGAIKE